ncbi:hypothetical protein V1289_003258 [Bradyrhizobium sp. AZCC 2289]
MSRRIVCQLADSTAESGVDRLPANMADQSKHILLGSIGCAVAAIDAPKGRAGIQTLGSNEGFAGRPVALESQDNETKPQRAIKWAR